MARYRLETPHFLGDKNSARYYSAGQVIDYDGPPSMRMTPLDANAKAAHSARMADIPKAKRKASAFDRHLRASIIPTPGGAPPDPTWAPQPRPAFSIVAERSEESKTSSDQADVIRVPASVASASGAPSPSTDADAADDAAADADAKQAATRKPRGGSRKRARK